jgi:hypothetical protein
VVSGPANLLYQINELADVSDRLDEYVRIPDPQPPSS